MNDKLMKKLANISLRRDFKKYFSDIRRLDEYQISLIFLAFSPYLRNKYEDEGIHDNGTIYADEGALERIFDNDSDMIKAVTDCFEAWNKIANHEDYMSEENINKRRELLTSDRFRKLVEHEGFTIS